jgi:photosystem II stability/assembly factor-like uncharacterized protein
MWAWLDRGERPAAGTLATGWTRDAGFSETVSLTEVLKAGDALLATAVDGRLFRRDAAGAWTEAGDLGAAAALVGLCLSGSEADARGVALGEGKALYSDDGGATWVAGPAAPDPDGLLGSTLLLNGVACGPDGRVAAGGYFAAATSPDGGETWGAANMTALYGFPAQSAAVVRSDTGTWLAAGYYDYLGRSTDGITFTPVQGPEPREWWTGVAGRGGRFWVVGEEGRVLVSDDDGQTFDLVRTPTREDLYAVDFFDAQRGLAVGAHGAAVLTTDGGATWTDVSTGLDGYLGGVAFVAADRAVVVGEAGTVVTLAVP